MRNGVIDSSLKLIISILIVTFIVSIGYFEINEFLETRDYQVFVGDINNLFSSINYLKDSNAINSFEQITIRIPVNQTIIFDNATNNITLFGFYDNEYNLGINLVNLLELNEKGAYIITLCYDCNVEREYLVKFT